MHTSFQMFSISWHPFFPLVSLFYKFPCRFCWFCRLWFNGLLCAVVANCVAAWRMWRVQLCNPTIFLFCRFWYRFSLTRERIFHCQLKLIPSRRIWYQWEFFRTYLMYIFLWKWFCLIIVYCLDYCIIALSLAFRRRCHFLLPFLSATEILSPWFIWQSYKRPQQRVHICHFPTFPNIWVSNQIKTVSILAEM